MLYSVLYCTMLPFLCLVANRFDKMREGEPVRKIKGKKRSFQDNVGSDTIENEKVNIITKLTAL